MDDSFLEDLELVTPTLQPPIQSPKYTERNITRRCPQSSPLENFAEHKETNVFALKQTETKKPKVTATTTTASVSVKTTRKKSDDGKSTESKRPTKNLSEVPLKLRKPTDTKLKPMENTVQLDSTKNIDRPRWSGSSTRESSRCSDGSSKENSRPSDNSRESVVSHISNELALDKNRGKQTENLKNSERFEVAMLNSVKEIVSTYSKNESTKIMRVMQEIYVNSQANLIKLMMQQSDDIVNGMKRDNDAPRVRALMEENERLRERIGALGIRNEELKKVVEELEGVKKENLHLKNRCKELIK